MSTRPLTRLRKLLSNLGPPTTGSHNPSTLVSVARARSSSYIASRRNLNKMFHIPDTDPPIPVHVPTAPSSSEPLLSEQDLTNFPAFKTWLSTLRRSLSLQRSNPNHTFHDTPYALRSITVQSVDRFGGGRVGFVKLTTEVRSDKGESLPGSVFLRGGSVGMMVILQPEDDTKGESEFVPLTVQPRVPAGSLAFTELPAGMLDDSGTFAGKAAEEIEEELGMNLAAEELVDLTALAFSDPMASSQKEQVEELQRGVYTSPGGCDEFVPLLAVRKKVPSANLKEWEGRLTGLRDHGEKITLRLVRLKDMWKIGGQDAKALSAWALYEGLKREGRLPV